MTPKSQRAAGGKPKAARTNRKGVTPPVVLEAPPAPTRPLSIRAAAFVDELPLDWDQKAAAIRAGYSPKTASKLASSLMRDPRVMALVDAKRTELASKAMVTAEQVLEEVDLLAMGHIGEILDFSGDHVRLKPAKEISERGQRMISSLKVKRTFEKGPDGFEPVEVIEFKLWNKPQALQLALQRRGLAVQKHEHTGKDGAPIETIAKMVYTMPNNGR